jgi:hypothetical protein
MKSRLFPSKTTVSHARCLLDAHGKTLITFEHIMTTYGEVIICISRNAFGFYSKHVSWMTLQ